MKRLNTNLVPPDGRRFTDTDGTVHTAASWGGLFKRVAAYRMRAKLPPGEPAAEVAAQVCQRNPELCTEGEPIPFPQQTKHPRSGIKLRVLQWLSAWRKEAESKTPNYVSEEAAKERANICAKCQFNAPMPSGCASCKAARRMLQDIIVGSHRHPDTRLGGCEVLGCDLQAAIHLDEIRTRKDELPEGCWRKAT